MRVTMSPGSRHARLCIVVGQCRHGLPAPVARPRGACARIRGNCAKMPRKGACAWVRSMVTSAPGQLSLSRDGHDRGRVRKGRGLGARKAIGRLLDNVKNIYILESNDAFLGALCQGISLQSKGPSSNIAPIAQRWTRAATRIGKGGFTRPFHGNRYIIGGFCRTCEGGCSERKRAGWDSGRARQGMTPPAQADCGMACPFGGSLYRKNDY